MKKEFWHRVVEEGLDEKDVKILVLLGNELAFHENDFKEIAKKCGLKVIDTKQRIKKLKDKRILLKDRISVIDPIKIWNHYFITRIKARLAPPVVGMKLKYPTGWTDIIERIHTAQKQVGVNLLRSAFALVGTEYDMELIVTTNSINEYQKFLEILLEEGWIEKVWSVQPTELKEKWIFDPIAVPPYKDYKERFEEMIKKKKYASKK